jgi:hypothetical protein
LNPSAFGFLVFIIDIQSLNLVYDESMTVFSLVAIPLFVFLFAVRHQKQLLQWLSEEFKGTFCSENASKLPDIKRMAPYPAQPIKGRERYRVMMDIRKLDAQNWLTLDKNYIDEHRVRTQLLHEKRERVLRCLPESIEPCQEALEEVSDFLCERFPNMFEMSMHNNQKFIINHMTGDRFPVSGRDSNEGLTEALEAAVRLTMEDLSILMMNEEGEYYLYVEPIESDFTIANIKAGQLAPASSQLGGQ